MIGNMWGRGMHRPPVCQHNIGDTEIDMQKHDLLRGSALAYKRYAASRLSIHLRTL